MFAEKVIPVRLQVHSCLRIVIVAGLVGCIIDEGQMPTKPPSDVHSFMPSATNNPIKILPGPPPSSDDDERMGSIWIVVDRRQSSRDKLTSLR